MFVTLKTRIQRVQYRPVSSFDVSIQKHAPVPLAGDSNLQTKLRSRLVRESICVCGKEQNEEYSD